MEAIPMKTVYWLDFLDDEDRVFMKRFILHSGSLKKLAESYGVSYPTVRLRLDRLIDKIRVVDSHGPRDPFELLLRTKYAEGRIDERTLKELLEAYEGRNP
ncbi:DUF2089 domain-containing protein [Myxococcota bacterium]|nr:DUF2089 domain-containing protein [Myxococcota bacterium]MBU1536267.1 DUF2089 domain-containing protein [Myxococcota bacterium]